MGIDLKVMTSYMRERRGEMLPTATLRFDRDAGLFGQLSRIAQPMPDGLKVGTYEDDGLTFTEVDRAGNRLTYCTPADLGALDVSGEVGQWNRAVLSFLRELPREARIVLFWC